MGILTSLSGPWAEAIIPLVVDGQCGRGASYEDSNISASYLLTILSGLWLYIIDVYDDR